MIKKLTISVVLLTMFILNSNSANAGLFDWANKDNENAHPLINSGSGWSVNNIYGDMLGFNTIQNQQPENTPEPTPVPTPVQKAKTIKTTSKTTPVTTYMVMASAYSSTPDQTDDTPFVTAWGTQVRDGIIAANFLPFGTLVKMPELYGDKIFIVEDRMNRRYTFKIDIWFPERGQAMEFGNKKVKIEVVAKL